jgi:hypothetical protein
MLWPFIIHQPWVRLYASILDPKEKHVASEIPGTGKA